LKNENVPFGIACTISDLEFDVDAVAGYLVKIIHPNSIEFNLRHDHDMVEVYQGTPSPNFDNFCRAWDLALSQGVRVVDIHKRVKPLVDGIPLTNSSSACKNKLVVMPNGKVSSFNGAIAHKELQRDPDLPGWKENFIEVWERELRNKPACLTCKAIFICGQGSGFSSYIQYGDFNHTPVFHCEYCLAVINYIETRIYNQLSLEKETSPRLIKAEEIARSFSLRQ
jgi:radical SAM protein with 4Fe4S-binding SPASM domain